MDVKRKIVITFGAALISLSAALPSTAHAAAYCSGLIYEAITYDSGDVMILPAWRADWTVVCNLNTTRSGVSAQTCFAWFAQIQAAVTQKKNLGIYYGTIEQAQCNTMATYINAPVPLYVRTPQ
jgi:hypothetical protein